MQVAKLSSKSLLPSSAAKAAGAKGHLCIAHGLLGNAMNWATSARHIVAHPLLKDRLAAVTSLDMRNHGVSPHLPTHTNADLAGDVEYFAASQVPHLPADAKQVLIGHSMGGLALIGMLLRRYNEDVLLPVHADEDESSHARFPGWEPRDQREVRSSMREVNRELGYATGYRLGQSLFSERGNAGGAVTGAVIVDITPTATMTSEVRESVAAMCRVDLGRVHSYDDAHAELIRAGLDDKNLRDFFTTNIIISRQGGPSRWRCNLPVLAAHLDRFQPTITRWFLEHKKTGQGLPPKPCTLPVLFVFGEMSYFNGEERKHISEFFPNSEQLVVDGAGHFVHHEKPKEFAAAIAPFVAAHTS